MHSAIDIKAVYHGSVIREVSRAASTEKPFRFLFIIDQGVFSIKDGNRSI